MGRWEVKEAERLKTKKYHRHRQHTINTVKLRSFIDRSWEDEKGGMADEGRWMIYTKFPAANCFELSALRLQHPHFQASKLSNLYF